jgi:uncharacterized membrane protein
MAAFLQTQMDYIFFFYGLAFVLLGVVCLGLAHNAVATLPWRLLGLFGLSHGLNEWFDLLAFNLGDSDTFRLVRLLVMALSFIFLLEFGRQGLRRFSPAVPGLWVYLPLLAFIALAGWAWGGAALNPAVRYALGLTAGLAAGTLLLRHGRDATDPDRRWLLAGCWGQVLNCGRYWGQVLTCEFTIQDLTPST